MTILPGGMLCHNHINRIFSRGDVVSQQGLQPSPRLHLPHLPPSNNNKSGQRQFWHFCLFVFWIILLFWHSGSNARFCVFVFSTNQVRICCCWENCEFIGLALICSEVGHKNELSCRGVVVRTTSDPQLCCCSVCGVEFAWWPECSVNCQMINVQCAKCVFCAVWTVWKLFRSVQCRGWCVLCQFPQSWNRWRHFGFH